MDENAQAEHDGSSPTMEPIRFRAGKKRKAYRQRTAEEEDKNPDAAAIQPAPVLPGASMKSGDDDELGRRDVDEDAGGETTTATATTTHAADVEMANGNGDDRDNQSESESAVLAALRLRNARRAARRGGVGFRAEGRPGLGGNDGEDGDGEHAMVLREQDKEHERIVGGITNRFMHQTGLLTILDDKHIRNATDPSDASSSSRPASQAADARASGDPTQQLQWRDQPTRHGKLVEVDMSALDGGSGSGGNDYNNKRRRVDKDTTTAKAPRRGRNRRNSDDIARDALVEQFLHENRLDVYDVPSSSPFAQPAASSAPGADPSADDRLAEQFRQQYYTEQALRRKKKRPVTQQQQLKQQKQQSGEILKGPKLGGSRNLRAAVRDKLLQQEKEKRGK
ncbi:hypothetical protein MKX07_006182 [Trichoderma sp. CBMAI-0711]|uniref:mRNA splicing factor RNA helicase n=1 Tax=Trichoderma parareesei TaxID=858221 RepID=A0A2H2ZQ22_TRIPA|nr:hypothetical protein MKX07_006182 [Trichoderma sp. CBMAI-0711]OTA08819.1 hypothetical protein A9Z42_0005380 [Trichoderma parareesei]